MNEFLLHWSMKRISFLLMFFLLCLSKPAIAQWNYYCYFPTFYPAPSVQCSFLGTDFINKDTGIYIRDCYFSPHTGHYTSLFRTNDGGQNWITSPLGADNGGSLFLFSARKEKTFFCAENEGGISSPNDPSGSLFKSQDGGISWDSLYSKLFTNIFSFSAIDTSHFYFLRSVSIQASPYACYLAKYQNGLCNDTLTDLTSITPERLFFPDTSVGYLTALGHPYFYSPVNHLYKTIDGGASWNTTFYDSIRNIKDMFFTSSDIGYLVCDSGKIIKTDNGGVSWQYLISGTTMNSIFFINDSVGFAAGDSGVIIRTIDGGINWNRDSTTTHDLFSKIFFVNDSIGFAVAGQWMYTINLRAPVAIWELVNSHETDFTPYPNPTSGNFFVQIPDLFKSNEKLFYTLYNDIGVILEQRFIKEGDKNISFDMSSEPKGIYFMTMSNGTKYLSGKIVLE